MEKVCFCHYFMAFGCPLHIENRFIVSAQELKELKDYEQQMKPKVCLLGGAWVYYIFNYAHLAVTLITRLPQILHGIWIGLLSCSL